MAIHKPSAQMRAAKADRVFVSQNLSSKIRQDIGYATFSVHPLVALCFLMVNVTGMDIAQIFRKEWTLKDTHLNTVTQPVH